MAWHSRHIKKGDGDSPSGGIRCNVRFEREDLLWKSNGVIKNPYSDKLVSLPVNDEVGYWAGPNIIDMIDFRESETIVVDGVKTAKDVWRLRDTTELFRKPAKKGEKEKKGGKGTKIVPLHQQVLAKRFCTGGKVINEDDDFVRVTKYSSVSLSKLVYVLGIGMLGDALLVSARVREIAQKAWLKDLERSLSLYNLIIESGGQVLDEEVPDYLRASSTVSQQVEYSILSEACQWLGVDPDMDLGRRKGRPKGRTSTVETGEGDTDSGEVIEITLRPDGSVSGRVITEFGGVREGTELSELNLLKLAELVGDLREADLEFDSDLLEAYIDTIEPNWREEVEKEIEGGSGQVGEDDPWEILGVEKGAGMKEVKLAYKRLMIAVHPRKEGMPMFFAKMVNEAYRKIKSEAENE